MRVGAPRAVADLLVTAVPELRDRLAEHHVRRAWTALVGADEGGPRAPDVVLGEAVSELGDGGHEQIGDGARRSDSHASVSYPVGARAARSRCYSGVGHAETSARRHPGA